MILSWYSFSSKPRFKDCFSRFKGKFKVTTIPPDDQENALKNAGEIVADGLNKGRRDNSLGTVYQLARDAGVSLKGDGWKADWEVYRYEGRAAQAPQEGRPEQVPQEGNAENLPNSGAVGGVVHPGAYIYENNSNNRVNKNEKKIISTTKK
jgi:hypothetical protein